MRILSFGIPAAAAFLLASAPLLAADMIEVAEPTPEAHAPVILTHTVVRSILRTPGTEVREVTEEEVIAEAAARGVTIPATAKTSVNYGHPWFIVKGGIGVPGNLNVDVEIYVHDNVTVEVGVGGGLLGTFYNGSVRWRPDATCWGCHGKNLFSIGFGAEFDITFYPEGGGGRPEMLLAATVDAMYIHRFTEHFGLVFGTKIGLGPTFFFGTREDGTSELRSDLGLTFMLYTGLSF